MTHSISINVIIPASEYTVISIRIVSRIDSSDCLLWNETIYISESRSYELYYCELASLDEQLNNNHLNC
jgi:hypothetical protein